MVTKFISAMYEVWINHVHCGGGGFSKTGWTEITNRMNAESGRTTWTARQLQGKLQRLKRLHKQNREFTNHRTGWGRGSGGRVEPPPHTSFEGVYEPGECEIAFNFPMEEEFHQLWVASTAKGNFATFIGQEYDEDADLDADEEDIIEWKNAAKAGGGRSNKQRATGGTSSSRGKNIEPKSSYSPPQSETVAPLDRFFTGIKSNRRRNCAN